MIMTLALFVYSIAQRRLRQQLKEQQETLPNQINQPTATSYTAMDFSDA
jgi:transposase